VQLRRDGYPMHARGIGDLANQGKVIRIDHQDARAVADIDTSALGIHKQAVPTFISSEFRPVQHAVIAGPLP